MNKKTLSILDELVAAMGGPLLTKVPEGAVSPAMLAEASGLNERTCWRKLDDQVKAGKLKKVQVRVDGKSKPQPYFVRA